MGGRRRAVPRRKSGSWTNTLPYPTPLVYEAGVRQQATSWVTPNTLTFSGTCSRLRLVSALRPNDGVRRASQYRQVEAERPVLDVIQVETDAVLPGQVA